METTPFDFQSEQLEIAYYMELQRRLIDVFRYLSCHEADFKTYSVIIESVLVDAGSFFDSQCPILPGNTLQCCHPVHSNLAAR